MAACPGAAAFILRDPVSKFSSVNSRLKSAVRGHPFFAATYDFLMSGPESRVLGRFRRLLVGGATGKVLEIGAGTGASFPHYRGITSLVATEPDPFMLRRARHRAEGLGLSVALVQCPAEALPFPDGSFDTVVSTLVLCTVVDQVRALAEVRRVLRPGGVFRFIEHVRAQGALGRLHDAVTPVWRRCGAGCHLNRRTARSIEAAGLEIVELQQHRMLFLPLIIGTAKPR